MGRQAQAKGRRGKESQLKREQRKDQEEEEEEEGGRLGWCLPPVWNSGYVTGTSIYNIWSISGIVNKQMGSLPPPPHTH